MTTGSEPAAGRRGFRRSPALTAAAMIAALALSACTPSPARDAPPAEDSPAPADTPGIPPEAFEITVESVQDGDTLRARVDAPNAVIRSTESTRIRLLGIDTPEISPDVECGARQAREALVAHAPPGSRVWAAPDREVLDRYGRHLLYLWTTNGRLINAELVASGDARVTVYAPNDRHEDLLRTLEAEAVASGAGQWSVCR